MRGRTGAAQVGRSCSCILFTPRPKPDVIARDACVPHAAVAEELEAHAARFVARWTARVAPHAGCASDPRRRCATRHGSHTDLNLPRKTSYTTRKQAWVARLQQNTVASSLDRGGRLFRRLHYHQDRAATLAR